MRDVRADEPPRRCRHWSRRSCRVGKACPLCCAPVAGNGAAEASRRRPYLLSPASSLARRHVTSGLRATGVAGALGCLDSTAARSPDPFPWHPGSLRSLARPRGTGAAAGGGWRRESGPLFAPTATSADRRVDRVGYLVAPSLCHRRFALPSLRLAYAHHGRHPSAGCRRGVSHLRRSAGASAAGYAGAQGNVPTGVGVALA